jgi:hypothetical protein
MFGGLWNMSTLAIRFPLLSWRAFDGLLRGAIPTGERVRLLSSWVAWQMVCAAIFGISLGVFSLTARADADPRFLFASTVKMPLLLFFTSAVTCPSLYVFGALRGLPFSAREFAAMLMVAHTILAAVLGSLAPVVAFFALTTTSYSFMVLLTVAACTLAGVMGVRVFVKAINEPIPGRFGTDVPSEASGGEQKPDSFFSRPKNVDKNIWQLLGWWVVLYIFVGAQMGWMLRPFIGSPDLPFDLWRTRGGSLVESVIFHLQRIFGG